jgi:hypothetical protein
LYWKNVQRRWRAANLERAKEIRREYWRRKKKEEREMKAKDGER